MAKFISFLPDKKKVKWGEFRKKLKVLVPSIEYYEVIQGYPEAKFKIGDMKLKMFCKENYARRTKFMRSYNTFIKISYNNEKGFLQVKKYIENTYDQKCVKINKKIIININKSKNRDKFLEFISAHK